MQQRIGPAACLAAAILLALAAPAFGATWHVAVDGDDGGPGSSLQPFLTIARAMDAAAAGDTVLIRDGTYTGPGNRDLDCGDKRLTVKSESGNPETCIIDAEQDSSGTGWIFVSAWDGGWGPDLVDGLTLRNGAAGGILAARWALTVANCRFESCGTGLDMFGGSDLENLSFENCGIGLRVMLGGKLLPARYGMHVRGSRFTDCGTGAQAADSYIIFEDCVFTGSQVALEATFTASVSFLGCEISGNGIGCDALFAWINVDSTLIRDNTGAGIAGRVYGADIRNSEIVGNGGDGFSATDGWYYRVWGSTIAGNGGAGIELAPDINENPSITIENSTVSGNAAGGILITQPVPPSRVAITSTLIAFNIGEGLADHGATYTNCVAFGNGADDLPDSWQPGIGGNFAKDPLFCGALTGDYGLAANSPCLPSVLHALIGAQDASCAGIPAPVPLAVRDVPNDQGGRVRLTWFRSGYDEAGSAYPILGYDIYRRIDAKAAAQGRDPAGKLLGWDYLLRVPARGDQAYQAVAATLCDSTITDGLCLSVYMVSAVTADPLEFFDSAPDSGWSTDDLAPGAPVSVTAAYTSGAVALDWDNAPESDFRLYRIYRDSDPDFEPTPANRLAETAVSAWTDPTPNPWGYRYKITTVDFAGNESIPGEPATLSSVGGHAQATRTALRGAAPNPFNPTTTLSYELAAPGHARLQVYDTAGRLIATLVDEQRGAGRHEVVWNGRDDGGRAVASGVYLYRLESAAYGETRRMVLLK
ncbi:MAG: right-handed parallel beta-helix repeat-containing protein [Krumholzibacteria bacterium]|nr:right-handed parallel beta-helix repeat-containing protein [Candidatus Krumholzibacteria bacterium]